MPMPVASLEPRPSISIGTPRSRNACLYGGVHMTPPDTITISDEMSYGLPAASASSSARTIGRAKASPTITHICTRWSLHQAPQLVRVERALGQAHDGRAGHQPAHRREPRHAVHQRRGREARAGHAHLAHALGERADLGGVARAPRRSPGSSARSTREEIAVPPHDALRQAGGAAGVEEDQIVGRPLDARRPARARRRTPRKSMAPGSSGTRSASVVATWTRSFSFGSRSRTACTRSASAPW